MPLIQTTPPAAEPVSIADVYAHLRLDSGNQEPAPGAPTVAMANAGGGNVDNGLHRYLVTFVTANGETQGGESSAAVNVTDKTSNGQVLVSSIQTGSSGVLARKVYRTAAGGTAYLLLATISDNTTTSYTDNIADSSLGVGAPATNTTDDPLLSMLVSAARMHAENTCRRAFVTQQWKMALDQFPMPNMNVGSANWYGPQWGNTPGPLSVLRPDGKTGFEIEIPMPPLQTIDSIKYIDINGVQQTLDPSQYIVDMYREPARVTPAYGVSWPETRNQINAVEVTFTCGYGAASAVPQGIKNWILIRVGTLFENREEVAVMQKGGIKDLPYVDGLLDPYRVVTY